MSVAFLNTNTMGRSATSPVSAAMSVTASGADRCAFAVIPYDRNADQSITAVTYGGQTMTACGSPVGWGGGGLDARVAVYYLVNPPTGSNTLAITVAGTITDIYYNLVAFTGVNQTTPVRAGTYQASNPTSSDSLTITSNTLDLTLTAVNGSGAGATTSNQTSDGTNGGGTFSGGSDHATTAASSVTHTYTGLLAASGAICGFSISGEPNTAPRLNWWGTGGTLLRPLAHSQRMG